MRKVFAHFRELSEGTPQLRTFSWDVHERHFYYLEKLNLEARRWPDDTKDINGWRKRWSEAFTTAHKEVITTSQELASRMAELASTIRALVKEVYEYEYTKRHETLFLCISCVRGPLSQSTQVELNITGYNRTIVTVKRPEGCLNNQYHFGESLSYF